MMQNTNDRKLRDSGCGQMQQLTIKRLKKKGEPIPLTRARIRVKVQTLELAATHGLEQGMTQTVQLPRQLV